MIRLVELKDFDAWLAMRRALWPFCSDANHKGEMLEILKHLDFSPVFISDNEGEITGFIECSLHELTEGCHTEVMGYVEGWYVQKSVRRQGIGKRLMEQVYHWAKDQGFKEIGSDAELTNYVSLQTHLHLGFELIGKSSEEYKFLKEIDMPKFVLNEPQTGNTYRPRKGCYGIIINDQGECAVVKNPKGYFLPGGGMEGMENFKETITRELMEEVGYTCEVETFHTKIREYSRIGEMCVEFIGYFYLVHLKEFYQEPIESDHELVWMPYEEAKEKLKPHYQRKALELLKCFVKQKGAYDLTPVK